MDFVILCMEEDHLHPFFWGGGATLVIDLIAVWQGLCNIKHIWKALFFSMPLKSNLLESLSFNSSVKASFGMRKKDFYFFIFLFLENGHSGGKKKSKLLSNKGIKKVMM